MGLPRSTFYDAPAVPVHDGAIVARIMAIRPGPPARAGRGAVARRAHTSSRRMVIAASAPSCVKGMVVNSKKLRRLMREYDLQPRRRRRYAITTDSNHDSPIFPNLAKDKVVNWPNQLWVADLTYIAIVTGFVYLAAILDAWSRRVIGYAISRSIDARLAMAALSRPIILAQAAPAHQTRLT
jgi:putative transposase